MIPSRDVEFPLGCALAQMVRASAFMVFSKTIGRIAAFVNEIWPVVIPI
jgi:hypothetical protein